MSERESKLTRNVWWDGPDLMIEYEDGTVFRYADAHLVDVSEVPPAPTADKWRTDAITELHRAVQIPAGLAAHGEVIHKREKPPDSEEPGG